MIRPHGVVTAGGALTVDADDLEFVTHLQFLALDEQAGADGREEVVRTDRCLSRRLAAFLGLQNVRVQPATRAQ